MTSLKFERSSISMGVDPATRAPSETHKTKQVLLLFEQLHHTLRCSRSLFVCVMHACARAHECLYLSSSGHHFERKRWRTSHKPTQLIKHHEIKKTSERQESGGVVGWKCLVKYLFWYKIIIFLPVLLLRVFFFWGEGEDRLELVCACVWVGGCVNLLW